MKLGRLILIEVVIIVLLAAIGGGAYYVYYQGQHYVSSSDAQLGGNLITVVAPASGQVGGTLPTIGAKEQSGTRMFSVTAAVPAAASQTKSGSTSGAAGATNLSPVPVTAPVTGRLASLSIVSGQLVQAGQPVAQIVSEQINSVTANIQETEVNAIHVGQYVDVYVNAYPGDTFPGRVEAIVPATQASLSILPSTQSSGTFTPVTQRVPVIIRFENPNGARLYMGMSVEVRVHISGNQ